MFSIWTLALVIFVYLSGLFVAAFWGDKYLRDNRQHPVLYSLGLGIHCTSWAFFGTTTQASQYGWPLVPTYAGVILVMWLAFPLMQRISRVCQANSVSSLADFIGLKFNHSHGIAGLVTLLCFVGVVPYIALQLDAIVASIALLVPTQWDGFPAIGLYVTAIMALFAVLFGTQSLSLTDKHPGLLLTIAIESLFKLVALCAVGLFVCYHLFDGITDLVESALQHPSSRAVLYADAAPWVYLSHVLLGACSMFVLPRQFHMNFIEGNGETELRTARWLFPLYLFAMTLFVLPIALAGQLLLDTTVVNSDAFVLALPLSFNQETLALLAFLGGLSATTSMIIVATLALGIMMANNLVTPLWLKITLSGQDRTTMSARSLLRIRRITVLVILTVAYWYHVNISQSAPLVKSGSIAIALLAQLAPAMLFSLYWQRSSTLAAYGGIGSGALCWIITLLYPSIMSSYYFDAPLTDADIAFRFIVCLSINTLIFILLTYAFPRRVMTGDEAVVERPALGNMVIRLSELMHLTQRVLDPATQQRLQQQLLFDRPDTPQTGYASQNLILRIEKLLAAQVGVPSARILLAAIASTSEEKLPDLVDWVEEASQSFQFNHELLQSAVQHIQQGISVLDQHLCLLAWNDRYVELFNYPPGYLKAGLSIQELLLYNASRGLLGTEGDSQQEIEKRVRYMQAGSDYKYIRRQPDGKVIELNGSPLPNGGYVTTYSDITEYIHIQEQLELAKNALEQRVIERTSELEQAKLAADRANESKTRFLAAAGHDLMQPFNAASLFANLLLQRTAKSELAQLSEGLLNSLNSAEALLSTLLDMTRLESGVLVPQWSRFSIDEVLYPLFQEFQLLAQQQGLTLHYCRSFATVESDKKLLRRIVQNLLSNAVRYTSHGKILLGVRRHRDNIDIVVADTGPGIPEHQQRAIFDEFHQLEHAANGQGLGLGLTIVERISQLLGHPLYLTSQVGRGTLFRVSVNRAAEVKKAVKTSSPVADDRALVLHGKYVLVIENDAHVRVALQALLESWGAQVVCVATALEGVNALSNTPDLMILDYHLDHGATGIEAANLIRSHFGVNIPGILNTANRQSGVREEADEAGLWYLPKPLKPAALKQLLRQQQLLALPH